MMPVIPLGPYELSSHALMLSIGAAVCFWLTTLEIERKRLDRRVMMGLTIGAFLAGIVGARGLEWALRGGPGGGSTSIFDLWDRGGLSMYGGLLASAIVGAAWSRSRGLAPWDVADTLVVAWVPLITFARIGCFLNGCCYGRATTSVLGMVAGGSPNNVNFGIPSHPTQLYDAGAALLLFLWLWRLRTRRRFVGELAVTFLSAYPLFRFFHEFLRGDARLAWRLDGLGTMSLTQVLSLGLVAFALVAGWRLERGRSETPPEARESPGSA